MDISITAIHFDLTEGLKKMINERIDELKDFYGRITNATVTLREIKPGIPDNKEVMVSLMFPDAPDQVAVKTGDSYSEAMDSCLDALKRQLERLKERNRQI